MTPARLLAVLFVCLSYIAPAQHVSEKEKDEIFKKTKEVFSKHYHFREFISSTVDHLDRQWKAGKYRNISLLNIFTDSLAKDLRYITRDGHLNFFCDNAAIVKEQQKGPQIPWGLIDNKFLNNGLNKVEILAGDIGYLRIQAFGSIEELLPGAFSFIKNTHALIIDLRDNGGGMLSNLTASYLLPEDSIHLITLKWNDRTDSIYTVRKLEGPRYTGKPVYLLTNKATFSSAEEFAYDMQQMKRATVVGAQTGGGANPGGIVEVYQFADSGRLDLFVPMAHVVHPLSGSNWEGKGVTPDVPAAPENALTKAHLLALETIAENEKNGFLKKRFLELSEGIRKTL